ncbi:hypothetical protein ACH5RR_000634 [Cinchona calisaya]|uniref:Uncharacterized protein n=1 Tax=Cinchona calisaya TaxID=153742 RepID=A0ABD3B1S1_9GENT
MVLRRRHCYEHAILDRGFVFFSMYSCETSLTDRWRCCKFIPLVAHSPRAAIAFSFMGVVLSFAKLWNSVVAVTYSSSCVIEEIFLMILVSSSRLLVGNHIARPCCYFKEISWKSLALKMAVVTEQLR